jgi:hypothetical protein
MQNVNRLTRLPSPSEQPPQIYRLVPPQVNQQVLFGLARRFGLDGRLEVGSVFQDARHLIYREQTSEVIVHQASGGVRYHDTARWQVDDGHAHVTFNDDSAVRIANRYINELSLAPHDEYQVLRVSRLNVAVAERQSGYAEHRVIDVGVAFHRVIDDMPVEGPGGKIIVYVDHEGELTGVDQLWREIESVHEAEVELRSPGSVLKEMERTAAEVGGLATIDDLRLSYFERDWNEPQAYLQPAYILPSTLTATSGLFAGQPMMYSEHFVAAAINPPEALLLNPQPLPPKEPQTPRAEEGRHNG